MSSGTGSQITRMYRGFRGADFRGEAEHLGRSPDCLNVWKDYREPDSIRTRPGLSNVMAFDRPIYGIHPYTFEGKKELAIHSGEDLYWVFSDEEGKLTKELCTGKKMNAAPSYSFVFEDKHCLMDGMNYFVSDSFFDNHEPLDSAWYAPTTSIGRRPAGGGAKYEDVNMLTGRRINTFLSDGVSTEYHLDAQEIDSDFTPIVKVNGEVVTQSNVVGTASYNVDYKKGIITFEHFIPSTPLTDGQDNVSVEFRKTVPGYKDAILNCTMLQVFDNRVFVSGNPNYPNVVWHCSLNDPTYFSDLDYYREGMDKARVKGMVAGNNALWVFREPSGANTNVFYHTPTLDEEYGKIYPSSHSSVSTGCVGKAINFNDDIVFFSDRGMEGISGDVTTEQMVAHRSTMVDRKLLAEPEYRNMILAEWEGYLLVFVGSHVYLADSRTAFTMDDHIEYEWFYWELEERVTCAEVIDGILYVGTEEGNLFTLTDADACMDSYWTTPKDRFGYPHMLKTTNKKGCVAEASGDVAVYAKTENTEFELIGTHENVADYFVSRVKKKKFKDIQLKFHSNTRFSLESVSLEVFVGAYIKR